LGNCKDNTISRFHKNKSPIDFMQKGMLNASSTLPYRFNFIVVFAVKPLGYVPG